MIKKSSIDTIVLAKRWGITPEKAQKTIQATTQRGIRTMLHPSLSRRFRMNDQNLCYHCLAHPVFSDMMFASTVSRRGNRCAQVYATDFEWARAFPMASKMKHMKPCHCCWSPTNMHLRQCQRICTRQVPPEAPRGCMSLETVGAIYPLVKCCRKRDLRA